MIEDQKDCGDTDTSPDTGTGDKREVFDSSALLAELRNTYGVEGGEKAKDDILEDLLGITDRVVEEESRVESYKARVTRASPEIKLKKLGEFKVKKVS